MDDVTTRVAITAVERLDGAVQARLRGMSRGRLRELIPRAIDGRFRLCIPPQDDDDDLILAALIDEVFALREKAVAWDALVTLLPRLGEWERGRVLAGRGELLDWVVRQVQP